MVWRHGEAAPLECARAYDLDQFAGHARTCTFARHGAKLGCIAKCDELGQTGEHRGVDCLEQKQWDSRQEHGVAKACDYFRGGACAEQVNSERPSVDERPRTQGAK